LVFAKRPQAGIAAAELAVNQDTAAAAAPPAAMAERTSIIITTTLAYGE